MHHAPVVTVCVGEDDCDSVLVTDGVPDVVDVRLTLCVGVTVALEVLVSVLVTEGVCDAVAVVVDVPLGV